MRTRRPPRCRWPHCVLGPTGRRCCLLRRCASRPRWPPLRSAAGQGRAEGIVPHSVDGRGGVDEDRVLVPALLLLSKGAEGLVDGEVLRVEDRCCVCVCVCVIFYLISRYMQPDKAMIAAPPKAVSPFSSAFFPKETSWSTGLACHSDPQIPTKERQRKRPDAPKINKLRVGWSASTSPLPAARASLLHILPRV